LDAIRQGDREMALLRTAKEVEERGPAAADVQGRPGTIQADVGRLFPGRIVDPRREELVAERCGVDIYRRSAVTEVESGRRQALPWFGRLLVLGAYLRHGCQDGVDDGGGDDQRGRDQARDLRLCPREQVVEDQLQAKNHQDQRPQISQPLQGLGRQDPGIEEQEDHTDRDQENREDEAPGPMGHVSAGGGRGRGGRWRSG
jgi:hypothetical protein